MCLRMSWAAAAWVQEPQDLPLAHHSYICHCLVAEAVASLPSQKSGTTSPDPFEPQPLTVTESKPSSARKTPESFLGPNAALVNLDSLVTRPALPAQSLNPFLAPGKQLPKARAVVQLAAPKEGLVGGLSLRRSETAPPFFQWRPLSRSCP